MVISILLIHAVILMIGVSYWIWRYFLKNQKKDASLESINSYLQNPERLRGHDLVASVWFDRLKTVDSDSDDLNDVRALVVAAATAIEMSEGRRYDGRPVCQGWMTSADFQAYFDFLDSYGSLQERQEFVLRRPGLTFLRKKHSDSDVSDSLSEDQRIRNPKLQIVSDWAYRAVQQKS